MLRKNKSAHRLVKMKVQGAKMSITKAHDAYVRMMHKNRKRRVRG